jgi:hypothetical protein
VDAHRRYADEPELPSWYSGQRSSEGRGASKYDSGVHEHPSLEFRLPDRQPQEDPVTSTGSHALPSDSGVLRTPVRGPEYPPVRKKEALEEPTSMVPMAAPVKSDEGVYNSRRPVSAVVFAVVTVVLLVPAVLLLVQATFADDPTPRSIVPAVLLAFGLPLTGTGLYGLAAGGKVSGREAWLRPPVTYLPVGLVLLLAAGLSVA